MCEVKQCVINREKGEYCFTSVVGLPTPPVIDGVRTHHVASNMAGTGAPSTKNFFRDASCCNSRVAVTRAPPTTNETLREEIVHITCTQTRDTNTNADVCANSSSLTATLKPRRLPDVSPDIKLHVKTLLMEDCHNDVKCIKV